MNKTLIIGMSAIALMGCILIPIGTKSANTNYAEYHPIEVRETVIADYDIDSVAEEVAMFEAQCVLESVAVGEEVVEAETPAEETTTVEESRIPYYAVNGCFIGYDLADYLYERLEALGIEWYYEYALCQLYQESEYDSCAVSNDGKDMGIAQIRYQYFSYYLELTGLQYGDVFDPYDSIYIYTWLMAYYLEQTSYSIEHAISSYFTGNLNQYNSEYVHDVTKWLNTMSEYAE